MKTAPIFLAALAYMSFLGSSKAGFAQTQIQDAYVTNGPVKALAASGNTLYIGGDFTRVGRVTGGGVPLDAATGDMVGGFPIVNGGVLAVAADGSGGWYIGGNFASVGGFPRSHLAHIRADRSLTEWNPSTNGDVHALALKDGVVYASGDFTHVGERDRSYVCAIDAETGEPTDWNPSPNGFVSTLAVGKDVIYIAGNYSSIGGLARRGLAAVDITSGLATQWDAMRQGGSINCLVASEDVVYVGGFFTEIGGELRRGVAALDTITGAATLWNAGLNDGFGGGSVFAIAVNAGMVYVGGIFTEVGGAPHRNIAAIGASTGEAVSWKSGVDGVVGALAVSDGRVYLTGNFSNVGEVYHPRIAALSVTSGALLDWNPDEPNDWVYAMCADQDVLYIGGGFTSIGGASRNYLAALDISNRELAPWNPNASGPVFSLAVGDGVIYAGGQFSTMGDQPRYSIAALDSATGDARDWQFGVNGQVFSMLLDGPTIYVGGMFQDAGGQLRTSLAALDAATGEATSWNPQIDDFYNSSWVNALAKEGGIIYAGGLFTSIGGQSRRNISAVDATTGQVTTWDPHLSPQGTGDGEVYALDTEDGIVYVGGWFGNIGGQQRNCIAALDATTAAATNWHPVTSGGSYGRVFAMAVDRDVIYVGGEFDYVNSQLRGGIAAVTEVGDLLPWGPDVPVGTVRAMLVHNGLIVAGLSSWAATGATMLILQAPEEPAAVVSQSGGDEVQLLQAVPSPFSTATRIGFTIPQAGDVCLRVYDLQGRCVREVMAGPTTEGMHSVEFDGRNKEGSRLTAGVYMLRLTVGNKLSRVRKMVLAR